MRSLLILWAVYCGALVVNSILLLLGLFVWKTSSGQLIQFFGTSFAVSIVYLLFYPVLSLFCWYMPIYRAFRKDSSLSFMWFFMMFGLQIFCWGLNAVGFVNLGASGIWLGASCIQSSYEDILQNSAPVFGQLVGSLMLIFTVVWIGMAVFGVVLFIMVCMCLVVGSREGEGVLGCWRQGRERVCMVVGSRGGRGSAQYYT
jgi:hypothetical protein